MPQVQNLRQQKRNTQQLLAAAILLWVYEFLVLLLDEIKTALAERVFLHDAVAVLVVEEMENAK